MRSDKGRPTVACIVLQLFYIIILTISLKTLCEFQPKNYKVGRIIEAKIIYHKIRLIRISVVFLVKLDLYFF